PPATLNGPSATAFQLPSAASVALASGVAKPSALLNSVSRVGPVPVLREARPRLVAAAARLFVAMSVNSKAVDVAAASGPATACTAALLPPDEPPRFEADVLLKAS